MAGLDWLGSLVTYVVPIALLVTGVYAIQLAGSEWSNTYRDGAEKLTINWGLRMRLRWFVGLVTMAGVVYGGNIALGSNTTEKLVQALFIGLGYSMSAVVGDVVSGAVALGEVVRNEPPGKLKYIDTGTDGQGRNTIHIKHVYLTYVLVEERDSREQGGFSVTKQYCIPWSQYFALSLIHI